MIGRLIRFVILTAAASVVFFGLWLVETDQLADFLDDPSGFLATTAGAPMAAVEEMAVVEEAVEEPMDANASADRRLEFDTTQGVADAESELSLEEEFDAAEVVDDADDSIMDDTGELASVDEELLEDEAAELAVVIEEEAVVVEEAPAAAAEVAEAMPTPAADAPLQPPPPAMPTVGVETQVISPPVNIIEGPQPGQVAYKPPEVMDQGETYEVVVRIGDEETSDIAEGIPGSGPATVEQLTIFPVMSVRLDGGDDFEVRALSSEVQWMAAGSPTQWLFEVTALEAGEAQKLRLFVAWELPTGDASVGRDLEPFVREIEVKVNRTYQMQRFVVANLEWGFAGAGAFFGFLFRRVFQRRRT